MRIQALRPNFKAPTTSTEDAGGYDIYSPEHFYVYPGEITSVNLGFAAEVPKGHVAILAPRSGVGSRGLKLMNTVGIIDSDYRGEWIAKLTVEKGHPTQEFNVGDRALQFIIVPVAKPELEIVYGLEDTDRGDGGFGSTGT